MNGLPPKPRNRAPRLTAVAVMPWLVAPGMFLPGCGKARSAEEGVTFNVEVERVRNGSTVKIKPDEKLVYAGLRAPYEHEPLFEEARKRNAELVEGKEVRLRFDKEQRDPDDHLCAYVFVDDQFVNEMLVREGLAWVRLTPTTGRYAKELQAAQREAQRARRGLWRLAAPSAGEHYPADPKYGNFHRPECAEADKIKPERRVDFKTRQEALERGLAPCATCAP